MFTTYVKWIKESDIYVLYISNFVKQFMKEKKI